MPIWADCRSDVLTSSLHSRRGRLISLILLADSGLYNFPSVLRRSYGYFGQYIEEDLALEVRLLGAETSAVRGKQ